MGYNQVVISLIETKQQFRFRMKGSDYKRKDSKTGYYYSLNNKGINQKLCTSEKGELSQRILACSNDCFLTWKTAVQEQGALYI